jgi:hypothetical protein|nr:MAG TPA: hypothetical protein [Caudoviricetes sp.]
MKNFSEPPYDMGQIACGINVAIKLSQNESFGLLTACSSSQIISKLKQLSSAVQVPQTATGDFGSWGKNLQQIIDKLVSDKAIDLWEFNDLCKAEFDFLTRNHKLPTDLVRLQEG